MILLDTNVLSELWRPAPNPAVLAWMDAQTIETLYLSTITVAELRYGIAVMPAGRRQNLYHQRLERDVLPLFAERILPLDVPATAHYARLMADARARGMSITLADGYIAAIAAAHGLPVATRDRAPFIAAGVAVINPFCTE